MHVGVPCHQENPGFANENWLEVWPGPFKKHFMTCSIDFFVSLVFTWFYCRLGITQKVQYNPQRWSLKGAKAPTFQLHQLGPTVPVPLGMSWTIHWYLRSDEIPGKDPRISAKYFASACKFSLKLETTSSFDKTCHLALKQLLRCARPSKPSSFTSLLALQDV